MARVSGRKIIFGFVLALAALAAGLYFLVVPAIRASQRAEERSWRANSLRQIGLALNNFQVTYKRLPRATRRDELGRALCSWRFHVLPYMEAVMVGIHFGKPWNDPVNRVHSNRVNHPFYLADGENPVDPRQTKAVAVTGPGTAFDGDRGCSLEDIDEDTILVIEIADSGTHWAAPGDLHIDEVPESITRGLYGDGVHVVFADGSVWFLRADVPLADLKKFFTIEGAKQYERDELLGAYADPFE